MICRIYVRPRCHALPSTRLSIVWSAGGSDGDPLAYRWQDRGWLSRDRGLDSPEHIERFMDSGLAQAMQEVQLPEPTITEFEVHKLDRVRG